MEKKKILIVDDDFRMCQLLELIVKRLGYESIFVLDGYQAISLIEKDPAIFLLITDCHMPFLDGISLLETVRLQFPYLKVVLISSDIDENLLFSVKNKAFAVVDKFDLLNGITSTIKKLEDTNLTKEISQRYQTNI